MSIATVITRGFGIFGTIAKLVTRGYSIGAAVLIAVGSTLTITLENRSANIILENRKNTVILENRSIKVRL